MKNFFSNAARYVSTQTDNSGLLSAINIKGFRKRKLFTVLLIIFTTINIHSQHDPAEWYHNPFNKNSAHHRPIGTGAEYASDDDPLTRLWLSFFPSPNTRGNINQATPFGAPFIMEDASYPLEAVIGRNCRDDSDQLLLNSQPFPVHHRIPEDYESRYNYNPEYQCFDNLAIFFNPLTLLVHEYYYFNKDLSTGQYRAGYRRPPYRLDGLGHGETLGQKVGAPAAGVSGVFGLLRKAELEAEGKPIRHALQVMLPGYPTGPQPQLLGRKIQWPATSPDGFANRADFCTGLFGYGMLIALPPESKGGPNLDDMNLSEPGRRLAEAIRNYGMYVIDQAGAVALRSDEPLGDLLDPVQQDFRKILPYCRVVTNSVDGATAEIAVDGSWPGTGFIGTPTGSDGKPWPAGGGTPLAPNTAIDARYKPE